MILTKTWYETDDKELLAIIKVFKTWRHYLKGCKHEVFVLTDHNNLQRFINTKSLNSKQVRWAQNCQSTISGLIINRAKLMKLVMLCLNIFSRVLRKKKLFKPKIQRSCTDSNYYWFNRQD